jgi:uncharacterized protein with HEPN domain
VRDDRIRLADVLEAIGRIEKYTGKGCDALGNDELVQTWVVHNLMMIGEDCRAHSPPSSAPPTPKTFGGRPPVLAT